MFSENNKYVQSSPVSSKPSERKPIRSSDFIQNVFKLGGEPYRIDPVDMRHEFPIYNKPSKSITLKNGRQTHKSTILGVKITEQPIKIRDYRALYVAPTGNQVSVFSTDKLDGTLRDSEVIQRNFINSKTKDQVSYKEFSNGSKIYLRSAFYSADSIRGISADMVCFDEIQDIVSGHIPVIKQCMGHAMAHYKHIVKYQPNVPKHMFQHTMNAGTPKTLENVLEKLWSLSTMNEWIIKCDKGCGKNNYIDLENVGKKSLVCRHCGSPIYYNHGRWVKTSRRSEEECNSDGYRMPQIVVNWVNDYTDPTVWKKAVTDAIEEYSTEKVYNEILALSYANSKHPLSRFHIENICNPDMPMADECNPFSNKVWTEATIKVAGIDWGKGDTAHGTSYTVLTILCFHENMWKSIFVKKYRGRLSDATIQIQHLIATINLFRCQLTIADTGDGRTSNNIMSNHLGTERFAEMYEHGTMKDLIKWDPVSAHYVISRTKIMIDLFMEIRRKGVQFFSMTDFEDNVSDFCGIYQEYSEKTRMSKFDCSVPDDAFHSYMFARMAGGIVRGEFNKYLVGGTNVRTSTQANTDFEISMTY